MLFGEEKLNKKSFLDEIKTLFQDIINEDRFREAYDLAKQLEQSIDAVKDFKTSYYELYKEYKEMIIKLKWVGLPIMIEDQVVHMFQHYFTFIFKILEYDIFYKLKPVLLGNIILDDRDKFKKRLIHALMNNQEILTSKKININKQGRSPKVSHWLKDYNIILGSGTVDRLARTQYLTNGKNIINLNQEEKDRVKFLFNLYEKLKLSSQTIEGFEEDVPVDEDDIQGTIKQGVFEPYKIDMDKKLYKIIFGNPEEEEKIVENAQDNLNQLQQLLNQYPADSLERKAVEEEINKLKVEK